MCGEAVNVVVYDRKNQTRKNLTVQIEKSQSIASLVKSVECATQIPSSELDVIFCGKKLSLATFLKDLSLSPATSIMLLRQNVVTPTASSAQPKTETSSFSSFYVYCKSCESINKGKLRIYCSGCSANSIIVKREPENWNDVLKSKRIEVDCENCQRDHLFADFKFKCVKCNEICAVLTHARGNWQLAECCVCDSKERVIFDLGCNHPTCQDCFKEYLLHALANFSFVSRPPHGYTILCPFTGCDRVVQDVHHFYVMGKEKYKEYQKRATEKLVALDDDGVVCPNPNCGQNFFWEPYNDDGKSQCPDCFFTFCRKCNERDCVCHKQDDLSRVTIEATTRKCPKCNVPTERNGGCAHIHCTSCGFDWCFKCVSAWTEECQWDHWF
ncbi:unnamed protein product [Caenorhabditis bovis]|uniref:E3 ubiquitin-protein ligase parkin n=1 Tax=Caenorhabditis bovis TaxID=2654633 RepID=A0A8S1ENJ3_9PELO|nr:unnamed protein product [Caenorhabditis bovis]